MAVVLLLPGGAVARIRSPHAGDSLDRPSVGGGQARQPTVAARRRGRAAGLQRRTKSTDDRRAERHSDPRRKRPHAAGARRRGWGRCATRCGLRRGHAARRPLGRFTMRGARAPVAIPSRRTGRTNASSPSSRSSTTWPSRDTHRACARQCAACRQGSASDRRDVSDELESRALAFEYIVSSGEGETFTFKSGTLRGDSPRTGRTASTKTVALGSTHSRSKPGDIVPPAGRRARPQQRDGSWRGGHVGNAAIRIARPDEYDSVAVEGGPHRRRQTRA